MDKFRGRASCPRCGWRGPMRIVAVENVVEEGETLEEARWENIDFARREKSRLVWDDLLKHVADAHRPDAVRPRISCPQCRQTIQLTEGGYLPVHEYAGKECRNRGITPKVSFVSGGSPGSGKRR